MRRRVPTHPPRPPPMAQLDRLLSVMVSNKADSIQLVEGDAAKMLMAGGEPRALTKGALAAPQLLALLSEIAPAEDRANDTGMPRCVAAVLIFEENIRSSRIAKITS